VPGNFLRHSDRRCAPAARAILRHPAPAMIPVRRISPTHSNSELYGGHSDRRRRENLLFEYFHGRSKLFHLASTVLAQRHWTCGETGWRTVSLETEKTCAARNYLGALFG